jgi:hypothetical protein
MMRRRRRAVPPGHAAPASDSASSSAAAEFVACAADCSSSRSTSVSRPDSRSAAHAALTENTRRYAPSRSAHPSRGSWAANELRCSSHSSCVSGRLRSSRHVPDAAVTCSRDSIVRNSPATNRAAPRNKRRSRRCSCHALKPPVTSAPAKPPTSAANSGSNRRPRDANVRFERTLRASPRPPRRPCGTRP